MTHFRIPAYDLTIKELFEMVRGRSPLPPEVLCKFLDDVLHAPGVKLVLRIEENKTVPLEGAWTLAPAANGGVAVKTTEGPRDPGAVIVRSLAPPEDKLLVPMTVTMAPDGTLTLKPFGSVTPDNDAAKPPAAETDEQRAIAWLAPRLRPDNSTKRDEHKAECMERFGISANAFNNTVWPQARKLAGLPPRGRPGPKPQKNPPK